jgi:hypothetical protein
MSKIKTYILLLSLSLIIINIQCKKDDDEEFDEYWEYDNEEAARNRYSKKLKIMK